jgi:Skp family chaperone for outer membrane proteins
MRDVLRIGGVGLIVVTLVVAGRSWSDTKPAPAANPGVQIGLVNLTQVIKSYDRYKTFQAEMKEAIKPFQEKDDTFKRQIEALTKEMQGANGEDREELEGRIKKLQRKMEDNKQVAQRHMNKKQEEQLKSINSDLESATTRYAKANGLDLVLHYNDAVTPAERGSPANITRKMQAGALMPLYARKGLDISKEIIAELNENLRQGKDG